MPRLTVDDYEALANFRYLLRKFLRFSKDFLRQMATSAQSNTKSRSRSAPSLQLEA
jgi:hypothetical protein